MIKKAKEIKSIFLASVLGVTLAMPLFACGGANNSSEGEKEVKVNTISATLLDEKVANLMSAKGIAIQDKTQNEPTVSAMKTKNTRTIVANADESMIEQPETEFVKQTENGVQDVHFYEGKKGDYTEWNEEYENHHHNGVVCEVDGCIEVSDEILQEEEKAPTIVSLDARVNKLYNAGRFTFLCVSSAVEGQVSLLTQRSKNPTELSMRFYMEEGGGAYLNPYGHYYSETDRSFSISYMMVQSGDKRGYILVKRSDAEEAYHYANYWSDDFNQSYIIDNETGKTYSLSKLPHIYSVENGVIVTKTLDSETLYRPRIDENDELVLEEIEISEELRSKYPMDGYLVDIYGNVVFKSWQYLHGEADEYGEIKESGFIFTGLNQVLTRELEKQDFGVVKRNSYVNAKRYLVGNDGKIYRFDFRGATNSIPVHVLNEQGEWTNVPETAHVLFTGEACWFTEITMNAARRQYMRLTQIKDGKSYFINAAYGPELIFTYNTVCKTYCENGYFVGVTALPTDGSPDSEMQSFVEYVKTSGALDDKSIVYQVGNTAFAYEDKHTQELVVWDRATETRQKIAIGAPIEGASREWRLSFLQDRKYQSACFQANTTNGTYYVGYGEKNPAKSWNEYSTSPIEKTENLDAFYELLTDKLRNR